MASRIHDESMTGTGSIQGARARSLRWAPTVIAALSVTFAGMTAAGPLDAARSALGVEPVEVAAQAAAAAANANCDPAGAPQAGDAARALGRVAVAGGKLKGLLGGRKASKAAADAVAAVDCAPTGSQDGAPGTATAATPAAPAIQRQTSSRTTRQRNCGALGAGCADGMQPLVTCMAEKSFWGEMANAVEEKRDAAPELSPEQVADMNADIAAMREAHAAGSGQVQPVDPSRPNRHTDWLTPDEYSQAATRASATLTAHRQSCNDRYARF